MSYRKYLMTSDEPPSELYKAVELSTNLAEVGTDCISRQAAIDTEGLDAEIRCEMCKNPMHTDRGCDGHCEYDEKLYEKIMQVLDERIKPLPSAQPEQRTGKWIKTARWGRVYYCDQCRNYLDFDGVNAGRGSTNFCPNCGAKMEVNHESD